MPQINKDNIIFLLVGFILGMIFTGAGGIALYKAIKGSRQPQRFEAAAQTKNSKSHKKTPPMKEFYLSFEQKEDLEFFSAQGQTTLTLSENNATQGKHSLMVSINQSSEYPGIAWEVYGRNTQNWKGAQDFHFDAYNNNDDDINLEVKFKSGADYPKKSFSYTAHLEPKKINHVSIPLERIAGSCDISQISYIKLFLNAPKKNIVLFLDNLGIKNLGKTSPKDNTNSPEALLPSDTHVADQAKVKKEGFDIFVASSLDRIFQDGKTLLKPAFSESASLRAAKNEFESFQIVVNNGRNPLPSVRLELSDLVNETTGAKIDKTNLSWFVVGYVPTQKPYYPVKFVGLWPDPLLPMPTTDIKPALTQPFWVTLYIPKDTDAGSYQGTIKIISADRELRTISVAVKVNSFVLPLESHLKTAFDFYGHETHSRYPKKENETEDAYQSRIALLNEMYLIDMLKHRMNPILNINPISERDLDRVEKYRGYGLNNFSIGKKGGTFNNNWPGSDEEIEKLLPLYRSYAENLKRNKMMDYQYIYAWDEGIIDEPLVPKICSMIHRADPQLKNMVCNHGFWEPEKNPEWGKDIDIWCFQIDSFSESKIRAIKDRGKDIWMYISGPGDSGSPNLAIDFDSIDYRIIPWVCWKYDIKGFLYWCVNWWPFVDPFKNAMNTKWQQNGNGLLYYPAEEAPIDSLRLEIFRDGMEDYEYLFLLSQKVKDVEEKKLADAHQELITEAKRLLTIDDKIASSVFSFTKDTQALNSQRVKIAQAIEELDTLLTGGDSKENTLQITEDFSKPLTAVSGNSFGKDNQLTFELYRGGTFIIDGASGYAWQKSDSYLDSAFIRSSEPLPKTYKISVVVGDIDYDLDRLAGLHNDPQYNEGPLNENGAYLLAITDELPTGHHTNDWWHQHRKVCIDVDNNVQGAGMPHPIFMVYFDKNNQLGALNGLENRWQKEWEKAVTYELYKWYRVEIEKTETSFMLYVYNEEGKLLKGGVIPFKYVWNEDGFHPDYLVIGDPHENYYQGSMKIKSISMPLEQNEENPK